MELDGFVPGRESSRNRRKKLQKGQPMFQGNVLTKNNKTALFISIHKLPLWIDQEAAVEELPILGFCRALLLFHVIRPNNHADMIAFGQSRDRIEHLIIVTKKFWHSRFRPNQQIGSSC